MTGKEVHQVLRQIGATRLHHANSVATSCTFLEQGGLLSRAFVEDNSLIQTEQSSDQIDKRFGVWDRIFLDHVDIHDRGGRKKGPNQYGPVLFRLDADVLLGLPGGADVLVTKSNPIYWSDNQPDSERWFQSAEELARNIHFGDFNKMIVVKTPSGRIAFPNQAAHVTLDDPGRDLSSGGRVYDRAEKRLQEAARTGKVKLCIEQRQCQDGCICVAKYAKFEGKRVDFWFS